MQVNPSYHKYELRNLFKRQLAPDDYKKLTHFAWVKQIKAHLPGTYSMYIMHEGGIALATNAICINEWLNVHGQVKRRPVLQRTVDHKIRLNQDPRIDNRTDEWSMIKKVERDPNTGLTIYSPRKNLNPGENITELVWEMFENGVETGVIATTLGFTAPNIYYHIKKKRKELDKQV